MKYCECNAGDCFHCPVVPFNNTIYEKENDNYTFSEGLIKCYKEPEGFYLDINDLKYKKCYYSCESCDIGGNIITHNCLK